MASDDHAQPGATAATGLFGQLQGDLLEDDDVVLADGALFFLAADAVAVDAVERHERAGGLGRWPGELAVVVVGQALGEVCVRRAPGNDAPAAQVGDEPARE